MLNRFCLTACRSAAEVGEAGIAKPPLGVGSGDSPIALGFRDLPDWKPVWRSPRSSPAVTPAARNSKHAVWALDSRGALRLVTFALVEASSRQVADGLIRRSVWVQGSGPKRGLVGCTLLKPEISKATSPKSSLQFCASSCRFELFHL